MNRSRLTPLSRLASQRRAQDSTGGSSGAGHRHVHMAGGTGLGRLGAGMNHRCASDQILLRGHLGRGASSRWPSRALVGLRRVGPDSPALACDHQYMNGAWAVHIPGRPGQRSSA